jgi:hypothetical protein
MTPEQEQAMWRNRFIMMNVVRIAATVVVLIGLLIWQTGMVREGGAPEIGVPMALFGLVASFGAPKYLARKWQKREP